MGASRAAYAAESRVMLRIALPIVASNLLGVTMGMTDLGFIGRVGREELAAAALGNTLFYLMHYPMLGVMTAVDTLLATAHGAKQLRAYGDWTQTGLVAVTALCVPVGATMMFVGPILRGIGQAPHLASLADAFCKQLVWGLPPYYWFQVLTKYLQAQHVLAPPVYVGLVSNGANVLLNWLLIFRLRRGFSGAPVATSLCRWVQLALLLAYLALWPAERRRETRPKAILPRARAPSLSPAPASRRALSNLSRHRRRNRPLRIRLGSITHTSAASVRCNTSYASVPFPPATSTTRASRKSKASRNQSVNARTFSCDARPRLLARALDPGASDVARASCENRHASPYRQNPPRAKCLHGGAREASASSIEVRRGVGTGHRGTRDES